jgi:hypothetical protein
VDAKEADRDASIRANERLFRELPTFPDARLVSRRIGSWKVQTGPDEWTTTSYVLKVVYATPRRTTADDVARFYRKRLAWQLRSWQRAPEGWPQVCCPAKGLKTIPFTTCFGRGEASVCVDTKGFMRDGKILRGAQFRITVSAGDPAQQ